MRLAGSTLVFLLAGCPAPIVDDAHWTDGLSPGGPCYAVNLTDGVDPASNQEWHDLYACLDGGGALAPFAQLDTFLDEPTRDGSVGAVLATRLAAVDATDVEGVSLDALLEEAAALLEDPTPVLDALALGLELVWMTPWPTLEATFDPGSPPESVVADALGVARPAAGVLVEQPTFLAPLTPALEADLVVDLAWTLAAAPTSSDPAVAELARAWPDDLAQLWARLEDPTNNRAVEGNSLQALAVLLAAREAEEGRVVASAAFGPALPILEDEAALARLRAVVAAEVAAGRTQTLPAQVLYLTQVDTYGGTLVAGEDSALTALLRLLATSNRDVECEVLGLEISLGNLAVALLGAFADLDPGTGESGVSLLGDILGLPLAEDTLGLLVEQCPALDPHLPDDIHALDRLLDPAAGDLLALLLGALDALDSDATGEVDHVADLADTTTALWSLGVVPPLEDLLRDVLDTPLVAHVTALLPALLDPEAAFAHADFPAGVRPVGWDALLAVLPAVLGPDETGRAPLDHLHPLLVEILPADEAWSLLGRVAALVGNPQARVRTALDALPDALAADPYLSWRSDAATAVGDVSSLRWVLVIAESPALEPALEAPVTTGPGALPTLTAWITGDTLDVLLATVRALASLLPEDA